MKKKVHGDVFYCLVLSNQQFNTETYSLSIYLYILCIYKQRKTENHMEMTPEKTSNEGMIEIK